MRDTFFIVIDRRKPGKYIHTAKGLHQMKERDIVVNQQIPCPFYCFRRFETKDISKELDSFHTLHELDIHVLSWELWWVHFRFPV